MRRRLAAVLGIEVYFLNRYSSEEPLSSHVCDTLGT